jgi:hypothetical protein
MDIQTMQDRKGRDWARHATECIRGHPFTPDNTLLRQRPSGRVCRTCNRERAKEWRELA